MQTDADVLVVGGGISGLTTAFRLQQRGHNVELFESAKRAGGVIGSKRRDGFLYETGPNSTLDTTPLIDLLLADLGIASERVDAGALASTRFIVQNEALVPLPGSPREFIKTPIFSRRAKLRLLREPFIGRYRNGTEESIAAFVRRRLGTEFLDYAVDPFVSGIYAGDPEEISVAAAFPRLFALEQKYGSLFRGMIFGAWERKSNPETAKNVARSFSFREGMQTLPNALAKALPTIRLESRIERIRRNNEGALLIESKDLDSPIRRQARAVVIATPAYAAADMVRDAAPEAARSLAEITYAPIIIVSRGYRRDAIGHSLAGFGFLVPRKERRWILGSLFTSSMFPGRAPENGALITTFAGGRRNQKIAAVSDEYIDWTVREELEMLLGAQGEPLSQEIYRWPRAIPQYTIGHLDRLRQVEEAEAATPGLFFCGSYRGGMSVGDCIKSAHAMAERVDRWLKSSG